MRNLLTRLVAVVALVGAIAFAGCSPSPPDSVLLIVVDTLRPDHLGAYGYARPTSPHMDQWARGARRFDQAWSTSSWTLPAFGSILTGRYPDQHGAGKLHPTAQIPIPGALNSKLPTLSERLEQGGWHTAAIVNNPFLHERFGLNRGFQRYDYSPADNVELRRADASVDLMLEWLEEIQSPFFVMLHLFDPHLGYDPPAPVRGRFTGESLEGYPVADLRGIRSRAAEISSGERQFIEAAYDEEIVFVDEQLGRLFSALDERGLDSRLLVILTSDHGEEFFEHGSFEHGHSLHQEVVKVPLLIRGPGIAAGTSPEPVSLVDLAPTILEALSLPSLPDTEGISLWPLLTEGTAPEARSLRAEGALWGPPRGSTLEYPFRLLLEPELGRVQLFNLEQDPRETQDLSAVQAERLAFLLQKWEARSQSASPDWVLPDLDRDTLERLRSLGYVR